MGDIGLVLDPCFERHDTGPGHPERAERLAGLRDYLERSDLAGRCVPVEPEEADDDLLGLVHEKQYINRVDQAFASGAPTIDSPDNAICAESAGIARLAAGSSVALCRGVARGNLRGGFAAVRPPGHHAERNLAMGFCLFNNIAVCASYLKNREDVSRVMIVDWDVHHGNGTQHIFESDPDVFYMSVHQSPLYPGTGAAVERGRGEGEGFTRNLPLPPGAGDDEFLGALETGLSDAAPRFKPSFILVSAGFDAHLNDPIGGLRVSTEAYAEATRMLREVAEEYAGGRMVSLLEGGYDIDALCASVEAHIRCISASRDD